MGVGACGASDDRAGVAKQSRAARPAAPAPPDDRRSGRFRLVGDPVVYVFVFDVAGRQQRAYGVRFRVNRRLPRRDTGEIDASVVIGDRSGAEGPSRVGRRSRYCYDQSVDGSPAVRGRPARAGEQVTVTIGISDSPDALLVTVPVRDISRTAGSEPAPVFAKLRCGRGGFD